MGRFLLLDIGAGTMDVLFYDQKSDLHYKAVARSPVLSMADTIAGTRGNLLIRGHEMGGGAVSAAIKQRAAQAEVVMTAAAAATIHHSPEKVRALGIKLIEDARADQLQQDGRYAFLETTDLATECSEDSSAPPAVRSANRRKRSCSVCPGAVHPGPAVHARPHPVATTPSATARATRSNEGWSAQRPDPAASVATAARHRARWPCAVRRTPVLVRGPCRHAAAQEPRRVAGRVRSASVPQHADPPGHAPSPEARPHAHRP